MDLARHPSRDPVTIVYTKIEEDALPTFQPFQHSTFNWRISDLLSISRHNKKENGKQLLQKGAVITSR